MNLNNKNELKDSIRKRNYFAFCSMFIVFMFLLTRLAYLQLNQGKELAVSTDRQYYYEEYINNLTFNLLDNEGENLFNYICKYYVVVDPDTFYRLNEENALVDMRKILYILRNYDKNYDISTLHSDMDNGSKKYEVDEETFYKIKNIKDIKGVYAYEYYDYNKEKDWNIKNILSMPVKSDDESELKDEGTLEIEIYNYTKDNYKDILRFEKDISENIVSEEKIINETNNNIKTTLNKKVQNVVEQVLREDNKEFNYYNQIGAVLMESSSGNILAMAQKNDRESNPNIGITNSNGYLIGSTFKTILYEAALEKGLVDEEEIFDVRNVAAFPKSDEKKDTYTIEEAFIASSNKTFSIIGGRVGADNMYRFARLQGLFDPVLGLQNEAVGILEGYGVKVDIDNASIGQKTRSTPLGILAIANTVVNDGVYIKPRIIQSVVQNNGTIIKEYATESRKVIKEYTAQVVKRAMISVVNSTLGTGKNAYIDGVEIGGKTGTTEYIDGDKEMSDAWFTGFFKYNNKYYTMVVFIPHSGENEGKSSVACLVFRKIIEKILEENLLN